MIVFQPRRQKIASSRLAFSEGKLLKPLSCASREVLMNIKNIYYQNIQCTEYLYSWLLEILNVNFLKFFRNTLKSIHQILLTDFSVNNQPFTTVFLSDALLFFHSWSCNFSSIILLFFDICKLLLYLEIVFLSFSKVKLPNVF